VTRRSWETKGPGPLCFGFAQLLTRKSHCDETKSWPWASALPKPKQIIDILSKAPLDVLPAASHRTSESFSSVDISFEGNYMHCHRGPVDRRARGQAEPFPDPPLARPRLSRRVPALPAPRVPCWRRQSHLRQSSSPAALLPADILPGRPPPWPTSSRTNPFSPPSPAESVDSQIPPPICAACPSPPAKLVPSHRPPRPSSSPADLLLQQAWKSR
jgi:hypothetical protein